MTGKEVWVNCKNYEDYDINNIGIVWNNKLERYVRIYRPPTKPPRLRLGKKRVLLEDLICDTFRYGEVWSIIPNLCIEVSSRGNVRNPITNQQLPFKIMCGKKKIEIEALDIEENYYYDIEKLLAKAFPKEFYKLLYVNGNLI